MKKNLSKAAALTMALIMATGITLTGCGQKSASDAGTGTNAGNTAASTSAASGESAPKLDEYQIKWYMPNSIQPDQAAVTAEMNKITKEKINATLDINIIDWGNYDEKLKVMTAASDKMDLVFTSNWSGDYLQYVNKGAFKEITKDVLEKYGPNILKGVPEICWDAAKVNGKLYAIINTQVEGRTVGLLAKKKDADKYGFDISKISGLKDMEPFFAKVKADQPGVTPFDLTAARPDYNDFSILYGIEILSQTNPAAFYINDSSAKVMNYFAAPETKEYLQLIRDWYKKGYIRSDASTVKDATVYSKAGKMASARYIANPDSLPNQAALYGEKRDGMVGKAISKTFMGTGSIIATMTGISKTSKDPDRCVMLYNLMYDEQDTRLMNLMSFGIEGKHYTRQDDVVTQIPNSGYWVDCGWEYGNLFNCYRISADQPKWYPAGPDMNNSAMKSSVLGFTFNPEPVKTELAQCASVVSEYYNGLFTGSVDVDKYLPMLLDKLEKSGSSKVIGEVQKQVDEWKASK